MKKFFNILFKGKIILIVLSLVGLLTGFLIAYTFSKDTATLKFTFKYTDSFNISADDIISTEALEKTKAIEKSWYTGGSTKTYSTINISLLEIEQINDYYEITVNKDAFIINNEYKSSTAKGFLKHLAIASLDDTDYKQYDTDKAKGITKAFDTSFYESHLINNSLVESTNNHKLKMEIALSTIGLFVGLAIGIVTTIILGYKFEIKKFEYSDSIYKSPFRLSFFKDSLKNLKDIKTYIVISILLAIIMVCKFIPIPSGFGSLGITFSFIFLSIGAMLFGPIPALMMGLLSDVIGFILRPTGPYFPGYTINAMLACFTYGMCFYKTHITFAKCLITRSTVNLIINTLLGSLWNTLLYKLPLNSLGAYILTISLPKNLAYLIPQSLVIFVIIKAVVPALKATEKIDPNITVSIF